MKKDESALSGLELRITTFFSRGGSFSVPSTFHFPLHNENEVEGIIYFTDRISNYRRGVV